MPGFTVDNAYVEVGCRSRTPDTSSTRPGADLPGDRGTMGSMEEAGRDNALGPSCPSSGRTFDQPCWPPGQVRIVAVKDLSARGDDAVSAASTRVGTPSRRCCRPAEITCGFVDRDKPGAVD